MRLLHQDPVAGDTDLDHSGPAQKWLDNNLTIAQQPTSMKLMNVKTILTQTFHRKFVVRLTHVSSATYYSQAVLAIVSSKDINTFDI
jgi:hypothetical protein